MVNHVGHQSGNNTTLTIPAVFEDVIPHLVEFAPEHDADPGVVVDNLVIVEQAVARFHDGQPSVFVVVHVVAC